MEEMRDSDKPLVSLRTMEIAVAAFLFLFGAVFMYTSFALGARWGSDGPQSGYFPFYVSLLICASSAAVLFHWLLGKGRENDESFVELGQVKRVLAVFVPAVVYVLGIQLIGIYVSSALYITLFMRLLGKYSWVKSVLLGAGVTVAFFCMFEIWFQVPLFKGRWDLTAWTGY